MKLLPLVRTLAAVGAAVVLAGSTALVQAENPKEINISYVKSPFNLQVMVIRAKGLLDKEFEKDGIAVTWRDITSGAQQAQAMAAGALDVASVMNTASVLMANAGGNPVLVASGVSRPTKSFAVVGKPGGPQTVKELKGKTIAGPKGTVLHQTLVAALKSEGMTINDVEFVNMDLGKAHAALLAGQVDAALQAASMIIKAEKAGARVIATADGLVTPLLVLTSSEGFAKNHPELLERVVKVEREATDWIAANREEALKIGAEEHGISIEEATQLADWSNYFSKIEASDIAAMKEDVQFLSENDMLKQIVDPAAIVLPLAQK
ncbi:MAG: NrtA/SsuA/CpmA family ABC transporter substrate-binding protein [Methylobacteriaceae bacterium]|jgi:aliphatic sulfonates family ABC transporter substrate-binding protein|nr:NrtA/SsuA/CpmA family ABC transporter substrate-binding protein [Methylobacteriaceae bacterium]